MDLLTPKTASADSRFGFYMCDMGKVGCSAAMITLVLLGVAGCWNLPPSKSRDAGAEETDMDAGDDSGTDLDAGDDSGMDQDAGGDSGDCSNSGDCVSPWVVASSPEDGDVPQVLSTVVEISFSEPMDQAATETAFSMHDSNQALVSGAFSWSDFFVIVTFTPTSVLADDAVFTVRIDESARDLAGNPLEQVFEMSFSTVDLWTDSCHYGDSEQVNEIAIDDQGNVYATGWVEEADEGQNIWVRKYDSSGEAVWTRTHNGPANGQDNGIQIAVDSLGNVYVGGNETVAGEKWNAWIRKYDAFGNNEWTYTYNGAASSWDRAYGITADDDGNVYATGTEGTNDVGFSWVRKLDSDGEELWIDTVENLASVDIVLDDDKNFYVSGYVLLDAGVRDSGVRDSWIRKYDPNGVEQWTRTSSEAPFRDHYGYRSAVDRNGNVYFTGWESTSDSESDIWIRKYNADGSVDWTRTHDGPNHDDDRARSVTVGENGNVYVCGFVQSPGMGKDAWIGVYDPNGAQLDTWTHNGSANGEDFCYGIEVDEYDNIYVGGRETVEEEGTNIWIRKYDSAGNSVD